MIRFSIVIPNYNSGHVLERAITSVLDQDHAGVQLIVADGGSTDVSPEVLGRYASRFDPLIQRSDSGQADALNYAFRHANGEIRGWLCADDELLPGSLSHVAQIFDEHPKISVVAGASERVFEGHFRNFVPVELNAWDILPVQNPFDQPSVFWRADLHRRVGELDTSFRLAFDWDFWCRLRKASARLHITPRALSRYYFSAHNKSSLAGSGHINEQFRVVRRHGPRWGAVAYAYRHLYRHFDLKGCLDDPPSCPPDLLRTFQRRKALFGLLFGRQWIDLYNWHFASLQERKLDWWDYKRAPVEELDSKIARSDITEKTHSWDARLSGSELPLAVSLDALNLVLNRTRLSAFIHQFAADADLRDLLLLESVCRAAGVKLLGPSSDVRTNLLALQPHRLWEYLWLMKGLGLRQGALRVLSAGGYFSLLDLLAALAGNEVVCLGLDDASRETCIAASEKFGLANLKALPRADDSWSAAADASFDRVLSVSLIHRLSPDLQTATGAHIARALKPHGVAGLTFEYGPAVVYTSLDRPYRHHPPANAAEVQQRLIPPGLSMAGAPIEDPQPGGLFPDPLRHVVAALFVTKGDTAVPLPSPVQAPSVLDALAVPSLLEMIGRTAEAEILRRDREDTEKQSWVTLFNQLNARITSVESAAEERLHLTERLNAECEALRVEARKRLDMLEPLRAECDMLRAEAQKRLDIINQLTAALAEQRRRIGKIPAPEIGRRP